MSELDWDDAMCDFFERWMKTVDLRELKQMFEEEYQRGYEAARSDILARIDAIAKTPSLMPKTDDRSETDQRPSKTLVAKSITEVSPGGLKPGQGVILDGTQEPAKPSVAPVGASDGEVHQDSPEQPKRTGEARKPGKRPPRTNVRGDTSSPRPEGLATTFELVGAVLDNWGPLTAMEVGDKIRERWWPGMDFKRIGAEFSTWISKGRLLRDHDGKLTLTGTGRKLAFPGGFNPYEKPATVADMSQREPEQVSVLPKEPSKVPMPAVQPTAGPRPSPQEIIDREAAKRGPLPVRHKFSARGARNEEEFEHSGQKILLSSREYLLAVRLRAAINKGHLSAQFLAETGLGIRRHVDNESLIKDVVATMNPKIAVVGLSVQWFSGWGFLMREITPAEARA